MVLCMSIPLHPILADNCDIHPALKPITKAARASFATYLLRVTFGASPLATPRGHPRQKYGGSFCESMSE